MHINTERRSTQAWGKAVVLPLLTVLRGNISAFALQAHTGEEQKAVTRIVSYLKETEASAGC